MKKNNNNTFSRVCTTSGFVHMAVWKVCGSIFEAGNVRHKFNVQHTFSQLLRLYDDIYIGMPNLFKRIGI